LPRSFEKGMPRIWTKRADHPEDWNGGEKGVESSMNQGSHILAGAISRRAFLEGRPVGSNPSDKRRRRSDFYGTG